MATLNKTLRFWDIILFTFCAIFGVEAVAATAAIGPSAISWWIIGALGYFIPSGLIAAELSSTYPAQGGFYIWIKKALGNKWAARSIWYYWISQPIWLPAIYIAIAEAFGQMFFPGLSLWWKILISIVLVWITFVINICPLKISKWVPNLGSITKLLLIMATITAAILYFFKNNGMANELNIINILPNLSAAIIFIPMIIYNLLGCELIAGMAGEVKNPARDIPKALILSTFFILALYLIATLAIWTVIPVSQIDITSGILQVFQISFAGYGILKIIIVTIGFLFAITLFTTIIPWNLSANRIVAEAEKSGAVPKIFGVMNKNMAPIGAAIISAIISTCIILIYGLFAKNATELFWRITSFSLVVNLFTYIMVFPSFIFLRKNDRNVKRPYKIPGPDWLAISLAVIAEIFILFSTIILIIQPGKTFVESSLPIIIGCLITIIVGEILIFRKK